MSWPAGEPDLKTGKKRERLLQKQPETAKKNRDQRISQLENELQLREKEIISLEKQLENKDKKIKQEIELRSKEKEKIILTSSSESDTSHSPDVSQFIAYLKNVYQNTQVQAQTPFTCLNSDNKQPFNLHMCHCFNSRSVLHGYNHCTFEEESIISMADIGKCNGSPYELATCKNILVEGCSGVGKTTFARQLCQKWAKGELLQDWSIVIRVELRSQQNKSLYDLFYHPDRSVRETIFRELEQSKGQNVVFILDGYDHLSEEQKLNCVIFHDLVARKKFSQATLMVLLQPATAEESIPEEFHSKIDQHIEISSFTEETIDNYITSSCSDDYEIADAFNTYLSERSFSYLKMHIPLHCAILTDLFHFHWKNGDKSFAPRTRTELYTDLVRTLLVQYLSSHSEYSKREWHIVEFTDLPGEVYEQFKALAQLAARGIQERVYVFDSGVPEDTLGLMYQVEEVYPGRGRSVSYSFLHLTLQEYMAAYYCSLDPSNRLQEVVGPDPIYKFLSLYCCRSSVDVSCDHHWPVMLFTVGLTKLFWNPTVLEELLHTYHSQSHFVTSSFHLLYETQNSDLIQPALSISFQTTCKSPPYRFAKVVESPMDFFVFGYCISHSDMMWQYDAHYIDTSQHIQDLSKGLSMSSNSSSGRIVKIETDECYLVLLPLLWPHTQTLTELVISDYGTVKRCISKVYAKFHSYFPKLQSLTLQIWAEHATMYAEELMPLFEVLPRISSLETLDLVLPSWGLIGDICKRLQSCQLKHLKMRNNNYPVSYCPSLPLVLPRRLETLKLSQFLLTKDFAKCVGMESFHLHSLELDCCAFKHPAISEFVHSLQSPNCLTYTQDVPECST